MVTVISVSPLTTVIGNTSLLLSSGSPQFALDGFVLRNLTLPHVLGYLSWRPMTLA